MIRVEALDPPREEAYAAFLAGQPDALLYQSLPYRDLLARHLGCEPEYLLALDDSGEIRAALPLMWAEHDGARVLNSLPYYGSNGGVVGDEAAARDALLAAYRERATADSTLAATVCPNPFAEAGEAEPVHTLTDERISQATPLSSEGDLEDALSAAIDSSARRNIRKARSEGYTVEADAGEMDALARIHRENMEAIGGLAKSPSFFTDVAEVFEAGLDYDVWVARKEGQVAAALLVFYFNRTAEYFTPTVDHEHRSGQPLAGILAEAMTAAARRGMTRWNWGGTWDTQTGVYRFKRKWGAEERRYRYFTQLNDASVLSWPRERFGERFPHFFVVPFSALEPEGAQ